MKVSEQLDNEDDRFDFILADEATHQLDQDAIFIPAEHNHNSCDTKGKQITTSNNAMQSDHC